MGTPQRIFFDDHADALIRKAYQTGHRKTGLVKQTADKLGISLTTVHRRAVLLGVVRAAHKTHIVWTDAEVDLLEQSAHLTVSGIINRLVKAGYPRRTEHSILQKMKQLGLGTRQSRYDAGIYSIKELARLTGINCKTLQGHIARGWLRAKQRSGIDQIEYEIKAQDIKQFFQDHASHIDIVRCDKYWLIDVLTGRIK